MESQERKQEIVDALNMIFQQNVTSRKVLSD